jgi:hypothetical protein
LAKNFCHADIPYRETDVMDEKRFPKDQAAAYESERATKMREYFVQQPQVRELTERLQALRLITMRDESKKS